MPKLRKPRSPLENTLIEELRKLYGGFMCIADICNELGYKRDAAEIWAQDLTRYQMNGRKIKYRTADVAEKLARSTL